MWARTILSNPATVARAICGEKGGTEIEASLPYPVRLLRPRPVPRAFQSSNPAESASCRTTRQIEDPLCFDTRSSPSEKLHSTDIKNGSRRLKKKLMPSPKNSLVQDTLIARKMGRKNSQLLPHSNLDPFGG